MVPLTRYTGSFKPEYSDKYDQYALLDFIEFMSANVRDVQKGDYHKFYNHYHLITKTTTMVKSIFRDKINECFEKLGLLYTLNIHGEVERVLVNDVASAEIFNTVLSVKEKGTKELLQEAIDLHRSHDPNAARDAVEKLWDAFERLKTYYTNLNKQDSANKIISDMTDGNEDYINLFTEEFHGFVVLSDTAEFVYKCTDIYDPISEGGVPWNDPTIGVEWQKLNVPYKTSDKDEKHPSFVEQDFSWAEKWL